MRRGFLYLVAIIDWHTRKVLSWRISNTLEADFCEQCPMGWYLVVEVRCQLSDSVE